MRCSQLNVRKTVLSVAGMNERGFYNSNLLGGNRASDDARGRRSDRRGRQTKFGRQRLAHLARWEEIT